MAVSVTSKGQVTIPKRVREALGITSGSQVEFELDAGGARLRVAKRRAPSSVDDGPKILRYRGKRIRVGEMHGGAAMRKAAKLARD
jgi:antitoxin PrlF